VWGSRVRLLQAPGNGGSPDDGKNDRRCSGCKQRGRHV